MPTVARRPQEEDGFQKFLQTINVAAGIGGRVADFIQSRKQLGLQEDQLGLAREQEDRLAGEAADEEYARTIAMGLNSGEAGRNAMLASLAAQGQEIDPVVATSAIVLGDIADPVMRESTREAIAGLLNRAPEDIDDRFIVSPTTLASESERDISEALERVRNFRRLTGQATLGPGAEAAARAGETGQLSLVPGSQIGTFERTEAMQNQINELLRVRYNADTGDYELDGAALNNAGPTLDILLQMVGEPGLPKEFDPSAFGLRGPNRVVSGPVWDTLASNAFQALWTSDENARQHIRDSADLLVQEFGIPHDQALALVNGDFSNVTVGNAQFMQAFQNYHRGVLEFVGNMDPVNREFIQLGKILSQDWGLPSDQIVGAIGAMADYLRESNPGFPVIENVGLLNNMLASVFGGPTGMRITPGSGSVFTPQTGPVTYGPAAGPELEGRPVPTGRVTTNTLGVSDSPADQARNAAMSRSFEQIGQYLRAVPPDQRQMAADSLVGPQFVTDPQTGEMLILNVTREMIDQFLSQLQ